MQPPAPMWVTASGPERSAVEDLRERLHVLEVEVGGVVQVDVRLPDAVDEQQVTARAVGVGEQFHMSGHRPIIP